MASPPNIFIDTSFVSNAKDVVEEQIDQMSARAEAALSTANSAISALSNFSPLTPPPEPIAPAIDPTQYKVVPATAAPPSIPQGLGLDIDDLPDIPFEDGADLVSDLDSIDDDLAGIGEFDPAIANLAIPNPPAPIDAGTPPTRPALRDVVIPTAPGIQMPVMEALADITIPTFSFSPIPDFDSPAPVFDKQTPSVSALANWSEPQYDTEILSDVLVTVRRMLNGETGLPQPIEQALYDRARAREDVTAQGAVQQAFDTWAGRGFEMPPGMLIEHVNAAQEAAALRSNAASRDIAVEVARIAVENIRQAVAQGIAAEQVLFNIFNNAMQRAFEMAKTRIDAEIALFNAEVNLFNAQQNGRQIEAQVYEARLRRQLAELEAFKAEIDGALALGNLNESKVRAFAEKVNALRLSIEMYRGQMEAAKIESDTNRNLIEGHRADIEGYKEFVAAKKIPFDAYETQMRGEQAKASIIESQANAFAATIRGAETKGNIKIAKVQARLQGLDASVRKFQSLVGYEREKISSQAQIASTKINGLSADVQRYAAELQAGTSANEAQIRATDVMLRTTMAQYEVAVRRFDTLLQNLLQQSQIQSDAIKAAGQMASQLAAGAMAAMHVQASISGSASSGVTQSYGTDVNYNTDF